MSVSEQGEWYDLSETERLRQQENQSLRSQNIALNGELERLRAQVAAAAAATAVPEEEAAEEEEPLPTGA